MRLRKTVSGHIVTLKPLWLNKSKLFTLSGIIKIFLAEAPGRKGKIFMFMFFFAPLRELFSSVRAFMAEFTRKTKILEVSVKST